MFTIIFVHKIIVMTDDIFGCDTCLALCQHINFKGLKLNGFSIGNVLENFEASYFFHSGPDRSTFVSLCVAFEGLQGSIKFFSTAFIMEVIMVSFPKFQCEHAIITTTTLYSPSCGPTN